MFEQISVTDLVVKILNSDVYGNAGISKARITVENANIRVMIGAEPPTTSRGLKIEVGGFIDLENRNDIKNFKVICMAGTAILNVVYA